MFQIQAVKNWSHYLQNLACFLACDSLAEVEKSFRQVRRESFQAGHICIVPFSLESSKSEMETGDSHPDCSSEPLPVTENRIQKQWIQTLV